MSPAPESESVEDIKRLVIRKYNEIKYLMVVQVGQLVAGGRRGLVCRDNKHIVPGQNLFTGWFDMY